MYTSGSRCGSSMTPCSDSSSSLSSSRTRYSSSSCSSSSATMETCSSLRSRDDESSWSRSVGSSGPSSSSSGSSSAICRRNGSCSSSSSSTKHFHTFATPAAAGQTAAKVHSLRLNISRLQLLLCRKKEKALALQRAHEERLRRRLAATAARRQLRLQRLCNPQWNRLVVGGHSHSCYRPSSSFLVSARGSAPSSNSSSRPNDSCSGRASSNSNSRPAGDSSSRGPTGNSGSGRASDSSSCYQSSCGRLFFSESNAHSSTTGATSACSRGWGSGSSGERGSPMQSSSHHRSRPSSNSSSSRSRNDCDTDNSNATVSSSDCSSRYPCGSEGFLSKISQSRCTSVHVCSSSRDYTVDACRCLPVVEAGASGCDEETATSQQIAVEALQVQRHAETRLFPQDASSSEDKQQEAESLTPAGPHDDVIALQQACAEALLSLRHPQHCFEAAGLPELLGWMNSCPPGAAAAAAASRGSEPALAADDTFCESDYQPASERSCFCRGARPANQPQQRGLLERRKQEEHHQQQVTQKTQQQATQGTQQHATQGTQQQATQGMQQETAQGMQQEAAQGMQQEAAQGMQQEAAQQYVGSSAAVRGARSSRKGLAAAGAGCENAILLQQQQHFPFRNKSLRFCRFYNTLGYCRNKDACPFYHASLSSPGV